MPIRPRALVANLWRASAGDRLRWPGRVWEQARDLLFPSQCIQCGETEHGYPLCPACEGAVRRASAEPCCPLCGGLTAVDDAGCQRCHDKGLTHIDRVRRWTAYEGPVRSMILRSKFAREWTLSEWLGARLAEMLTESGDLGGADCVMAVPQHPLRTLQRGFNPADLVAMRIARASGLKLFGGLRRVRATEVQSRQVGRAGRARNVAGAFRCKPGVGDSVLLVDDVLTTGATAVECARAMKRAGVKRVEVAVVAVADPRTHEGEV